MPASQGAPSRCNAVPLRDSRPPGTPGPGSRVHTAVVLWAAGALVAAGSLTACEYSYDEGRTRSEPGSSAAPAVPDPSFTNESLEDEPVSQAEMGSWLQEALPDTEREVIHVSSGVLIPGEIRVEKAENLPIGTYALALVCRSQRRVTFTVRTEEYTLVDLGLRCGPTRENVIYLSRPSALTFRVEARYPANYAIRLTRL